MASPVPSLSWPEALRALRPGSRTVVFRPPTSEPVVELARRGFRLLVVHPQPEFCQACRSALRELGLSSQLMGSHHHRPGEPLKLADDFYDLILIFAPHELAPEEVEPSLAPQGRLVRIVW